jgi:uncharacterized protein YbbK (DUF523 family)
MAEKSKSYSLPDLNRLASTARAEDEIRIGVSACLTGCEVRWDGGHRLNEVICAVADAGVTLVPICPEVDLGMATPREPIQLLRRNHTTHLVAVESNTDYTKRMADYATRMVAALRSARVAGFVLKSSSPSCGREGVAVVDPEANQVGTGPGSFARMLLELWPELPVEAESDLSTVVALERFVERARAFRG